MLKGMGVFLREKCNVICLKCSERNAHRKFLGNLHKQPQYFSIFLNLTPKFCTTAQNFVRWLHCFKTHKYTKLVFFVWTTYRTKLWCNGWLGQKHSLCVFVWQATCRIETQILHICILCCTIYIYSYFFIILIFYFFIIIL